MSTEHSPEHRADAGDAREHEHAPGEHDLACEVAHGTAPEPARHRTLVAVFDTPVARLLLRYGADAGYRAVLVEPDPGIAASASDEAFTVADGIGTGLAGSDGLADVVLTDHHRAEIGPVLRDALASPARWVGIMGSPRQEAPHLRALADLGVPAPEIDRVHRPIGLNIGSQTPAEIAIATLAGLIADRNGRPGGFSF